MDEKELARYPTCDYRKCKIEQVLHVNYTFNVKEIQRANRDQLREELH